MTFAAADVRRRIVIALALALAMGLIAYAGTRGAEVEDPALIDAAVEALIPAADSPSVVRQAEIGIDLAPGWTGVLSINGVEIPEDQLRRNEPLNQFFFRPEPGAEIEALAPGPVVVTATIWRPGMGETRDDGRSITWQFRVA